MNNKIQLRNSNPNNSQQTNNKYSKVNAKLATTYKRKNRKSTITQKNKVFVMFIVLNLNLPLIYKKLSINPLNYQRQYPN
jgi:hypothetical protein